MNNSAENNNLEIFLRNKTGGIHSRKYSISPSYKKKKEKTQQSTKQKLAITENALTVRNRRLRGLFPIVSRRNLCKQRSGEERFGS